MTLNTFACTVQPIHSTGLSIVRCPDLGWRDVYLTDDHGNLLPVACMGAVAASLHGSEQVH
jgi:hypothetical protein